MRLMWTFFAGMLFAGLVLLASAPLWGGAAALAWLTRGPLWTTLAGQSFFAVRQTDGLLAGRVDNVTFRPLSVAVPGQPRRRQVLARLEVVTTEFADAGPDGQVRLDVWPLTAAADLRRAPLYTLLVPGRGADFSADGMVVVRRKGGRRGVYSLTDGRWLFNSDTPLAVVASDGDRKRYVGLAVADGLPGGAVAVLTYAAPGRVIRRLLLRADDPVRGQVLRGAVSMLRPIAQTDDDGRRVLEVPMPAGVVRVPFAGDDLDPAAAKLPAGLDLDPVTPWNESTGK